MPTTVLSSLVSSLRKCRTYTEMKAQLEDEIVFLSDCGPDMGKSGHANVAVEQPPQEDKEQDREDDQCPEGVLEVDLAGFPTEQAEQILLAARQAGLRVWQPFRRAPGGGGGGRFQPKPKAKVPPRLPTPTRTGERESNCANCGGAHGTRDCPKAELPEAKRKCFNCGEEGHRASACKKLDRRKQNQSGGRAMLVKEHPLCEFPRRQPGVQARRKAAAKSLIGGKACK